MDAKLIIDIVGWIGSIALITGFALNSYEKIAARSYTYQGLNLIGGFFLIINTAYYGAFPSTVVNVIWVVVGTFALVSIMRKRQLN